MPPLVQEVNVGPLTGPLQLTVGPRPKTSDVTLAADLEVDTSRRLMRLQVTTPYGQLRPEEVAEASVLRPPRRRTDRRPTREGPRLAAKATGAPLERLLTANAKRRKEGRRQGLAQPSQARLTIHRPTIAVEDATHLPEAGLAIVCRLADVEPKGVPEARLTIDVAVGQPDGPAPLGLLTRAKQPPPRQIRNTSRNTCIGMGAVRVLPARHLVLLYRRS